MYYGLKATTRLRKEPECAVLFSAEDTGTLHYVHPLYALLLALCDGERRREDLEQVLVEAFSFDAADADTMVETALREFAEYFDARPRPFATRRSHDPVEFLYKPEGDPALRRLSAPISIAWLVTERCPYDCVYCCIRTRSPSAGADGELTQAQARAFLEDCVATGVEALTVHGGEPFLRKDLPELLGFLIGEGVHVSISTKLPLAVPVVARLAEAGLDSMQVSLDSPHPEEADRIVGRPGYLAVALRNVALLEEHGIEPRVNVVVTRRNIGDIPRLIRRLAASGVGKVTLSGYLRSFWKHDDALLPGGEALAALGRQVDALARELPEVEVSMCPTVSPRQSSLASEGLSACSGGKSGLVVGADGRVSICDRLVTFEELCVGNVLDASLAEIWNGEALWRLLDPDRAAFEGTACERCNLFEQCNRRVRCYYRTKMVDDRTYGPDYLCPVVPAPPIAFF